MSETLRLVLVRADGVRAVRRRFWRVTLGAVLAVVGCAATGVTLRSNHFRLAVPPDWQLVEAGGGGEIPTLIRAPASGGAPEVDIRLFPWLVGEVPVDAAGEVLKRLAAMNVIGLAAARTDDAEPCPDRAAQFFVLGRPARAIHLTNTEGRRIVVTAGESRGSLVAVVAAIAAGTSACSDIKAMDAAIERLAASLTGAADLLRPAPQPTILEDQRGRSIEIPPADPAPP